MCVMRLAVALLQPGEIALDAGPRQRIVDEDLMPLAGEPVGEVASR